MRHSVKSLRESWRRAEWRRDGRRTNVGRRRPWPSPDFLHLKSDGPHFGFRKKWRRSSFAELVQQVPTFKLAYPSGYERLPEVINTIEQISPRLHS